MKEKVSDTYFRVYHEVYALAKRAGKAYCFACGVTDENFIKFGYWDSLKKGLLAGEGMYLSLKQMERAYIDDNKRGYEITKNISLLFHDPMALITLKELGYCEFHLPEELFDLDYPGHYMRRIKSVSLTIPCVTGPYTNVNCTLTLLNNEFRISNDAQSDYSRQLDYDPRFITNFAACAVYCYKSRTK